MLKEIKEYWKNEQLKAQYFVDRNGIKQGLYKHFDSIGEINESGFIKNGSFEGVFKRSLDFGTEYFLTAKNKFIHGVDVSIKHK